MLLTANQLQTAFGGREKAPTSLEPLAPGPELISVLHDSVPDMWASPKCETYADTLRRRYANCNDSSTKL